jgi:DNA-binding NtrC family response regulator
VTLRVPPLRDRAEDIPRLAQHFLDRLHAPGAPPRAFSSAALARLSAYRWPGNVRELRNVVERLTLLSPPGSAATIEAGEVAAVLQEDGPRRAGASADDDHVSLEAVEKAHILRMLQAHGGNKTQTARALGIDYKTLLSKLARYGPDR